MLCSLCTSLCLSKSVRNEMQCSWFFAKLSPCFQTKCIHFSNRGMTSVWKHWHIKKFATKWSEQRSVCFSHMSFDWQETEKKNTNGKTVNASTFRNGTEIQFNENRTLISTWNWLTKIGTTFSSNLKNAILLFDMMCVWLFPCQRRNKESWRERFFFLFSFHQIISLNGSRKCILSNGGCRKSITLTLPPVLFETVLDLTSRGFFAFIAKTILTLFNCFLTYICGKMNA